MNIKTVFVVILIFVLVMTMVVTLGDQFNSKGLMSSQDLAVHNKIKKNIDINYNEQIATSNTRLEAMRNRLQQENKENSFAFQFSQALVWAYDLLKVINSIVNITTTLSFLIGIQNAFLLSIFALLDWCINFFLGYAIWRALFK